MLGSGKSATTSPRQQKRKGADKTMDSVKRLGLLDNEDIHVMMKGSNMVKIRSPRWQKNRTLRLLEDGLTVWCESTKSSRKAKAQQTFAVTEVECVREGCQSEALKRLSGTVPENQCFTVVFRGARKSLDLLCPCEDVARRWVRGLRTLKERVANMTQTEKLDHWIRGYLRRADQNQDGKMCYDEVKHLLRMINIDLSEHYARSLFKRCDRSGDGRLDHIEIEEFCRELMRRPELDAVFRHYSSNGCVLSTAELRDFLGDQGEDASLNHAQSLILTYELNDWAQKNLFMTQNGFAMYMLSCENDLVNPDHKRVYQDMSRPLAHYFISSSHNTYLTKDQVTSASSTEPYIRALNQGCRCVELDCWDGDKGEPVIYHGHTLTSKVLFKEVIETINQYAFKASPYPLILSLENHCSVEQQAVMAKHLRTILGSKLLTKPLSGQLQKNLPSPEELKGCILVKGKKHIPHLGQLGRTSSFASSSGSDDEQASSIKNTPKRVPAKVCPKLSPELSELVVYCRSVPFSGFENTSEKLPNEMSSFSESDALRLIKDSGKLFVRHNSRQLSRIYPSGQRLQSSNYDPQDMWNGGCQMVALNFQTSGEQMDLNQGRFLPNGHCGYVLKPSFLCSATSNFNPENTGGGPGHIPTQLTIRVISAQQLPKINTEKASSIVDPQVWVEIHGVAIDNAKNKTHRIDNNGFNPQWNCTLSFPLQVPELALVRFVVEDHDHTSKNGFVGQFTLPFISLRTGYRHVHLLKADGSSLSPATLFIHVKVTRKGVPIKTVSAYSHC
ncbi:1-phosphatidylinositol 4,5-bisphosphate phosphodiesterase delta-3-A [Thunnus thynnus]|uniref:1-phosphatidylinositol 4,5-bisphosphate phosphodiesterase delta-3-A n=2 Tax=Thunnus TaxID=8234 RepID=UPI001C4AF873|nr:1-phosphatidylinositol 4,5-bisphosphate phosphodiesterase delta-3-A isoform X1 [Thunnus maccoyii]XP_042248865.1 1-phosphatidylinositol 4,5-bisphosphate phosphodiesterase delta-3-A isoform X1 [Thunnus maccoyii]XP_042248866.1 1-phosphatidylinositol 4,5-bisphosphate phosphodiesterase delta-3-A isoform X1 [Thunnus maccoyii]